MRVALSFVLESFITVFTLELIVWFEVFEGDESAMVTDGFFESFAKEFATVIVGGVEEFGIIVDHIDTEFLYMGAEVNRFRSSFFALHLFVSRV